VKGTLSGGIESRSLSNASLKKFLEQQETSKKGKLVLTILATALVEKQVVVCDEHYLMKNLKGQENQNFSFYQDSYQNVRSTFPAIDS